MKRALILILFIIGCLQAGAQPNMVPNGSFEDTLYCPTGLFNLPASTGWSSFTNASPDYFHACHSSSAKAGVPSNQFGAQYAVDGVAYAGVYNYISWNGTYKELMQRTIIPLQLDAKYEVSMSVSLSDKSILATDGLGVFFFRNGPVQYNGFTIPAVSPQVSFTNYGSISNKSGWVRLVGTFVADSAYNHMAIGGFLLSNQMQIDTANGGTTYDSYYYIDSVVVRIMDTLSIGVTAYQLCILDSFDVDYYCRVKFNSNNVFTIQLSDSTGDFSSPIDIGSTMSDTSGLIRCAIPANVIPANGYRVRVVSSDIKDTSLSNVVDIRIDSLHPSKPNVTGDTSLCVGDTLNLIATASLATSWNWWCGAGNISDAAIVSIDSVLVSNQGYYIVQANRYGCKSDLDSVFVVVTQYPYFTAASNTPVCVGDTLHLGGNDFSPTGTAYSWTGPSGFSASQFDTSIINADSSMAGAYILTGLLAECVTTDTIMITVKPVPVFIGTSNAPLCSGGTLQFNASSSFSGVSYSWSGPNSFNSSVYNPSISGASPVHNGDYFVTGTLSGCTYDDTVSVTINIIPAKPTPAYNSPLCAGDTLKLATSTTTSGVTYSWTGPNSFTDTVQSPSIGNSTTTMSGVYTSTVTKDGCSNSDTTHVTVKPAPTPVTLSNNSSLCTGDTLKLNSTASTSGVTYSWSGPASFSANTQNTTRVNATPNMTGWYKMIVDMNGCVYADSTQAFIYPIPSISSIAGSNPLCIGDTLKLTTGNYSGATYSWSGPNNFNSTQRNPIKTNMSFADTGTYRLTIAANGCVSPQDSVRVSVNPQPFVVILANKDTLCVGDAVTFTALPNNVGGTPTYQWFVNAQFVSTGVSYTISTLKHNDVIRCDMTEYTKCANNFTDASNDIQMTVLPWLAPSVSITANPTGPVKEGIYIDFTAVSVNAGKTPQYQWKRNGADVIGAQSNIWSANTLNDNDSISVQIVSSYLCPLPTTAVSNSIKVHILTSVEDIEGAENMVLFPNPNTGKFVLSGSMPTGRYELNVVNTLGQKVYGGVADVKGSELKHEIELPEVSAGLYLLTVKDRLGNRVNIAFRVQK